MKNSFIKTSQKFVLFLIGVFFLASPVNAATLEFSPASGSYTTGTAFNVEIKVDTKSEDTTSTDAVIVFDNKLLSVDNVTYGAFYSTVLHSEQNSKLYISGMVDSAGSVKNGTGTLATVSFKGLTAGTATLSFECEAGRTDDSNVSKNDIDSTDILDCTALNNGSYTLTGSTVSTPTPNPADTDGDGTGDLPTTDGSGTDTSTGTPGTGAPGVATIPNTGFADLLRLAPKLIMGVLFIVAGLIPLFI